LLLSPRTLVGRADHQRRTCCRQPLGFDADGGDAWLASGAQHRQRAPMPCLRDGLVKTRYAAWVGIAERDHRSLAFMEPEKVRAVWDELIRAGYKGVLTLEIFSEEDFISSLQVIEKIG